ncbi:cytochrome P450 [Desarmillaria tabescens]|uniref:Cytochrome P450 n=1 Tax=Armillaria tabescens TaxID=1929756 RepID=A0AA39K8Q5_ARMTA|nr:cytochrome P450 [Desarmillaria tabescens]KAK0455304.1 cytochrome P450 [Desarmillaria tabescens]
MESILHYLVLAAIAYCLIAVPVRLWKHRYVIRKIRGPPRPSFLLGLLSLTAVMNPSFSGREYIGDLEIEWYQQYGTVYRTSGCFGQDTLSVSDPKALQYIFHSSGYRFPKTRDAHRIGEALSGPGVVTVEGKIHQRQRRILGPAFAAPQLRNFLSVFQASAMKLTEKITEHIGDAKELNVLKWTSKAALDIIGITSFRYKFNSLDGAHTELMGAMDNLLGEALMWPTTWEILFTALCRILPEWVFSLLSRLPNRDAARLSRFRDVATKVSRPIFEKQLIEVANDVDPAEKDIVNVLAMSYLADGAKKMSDIEIDSQLATFIGAGHDTTATMMAWLLYELSRHPEDQAKVREEIAMTKLNAPGPLTSGNYNSMPLLNAVIKEVLRYHPLVHGLYREPAQDDVLPLAEPIIMSDGKACSQVPIAKGQLLTGNIPVFRLFGGDDAGEWNPRRFLEDRGKKQESLGVYANLMTSVRTILPYLRSFIDYLATTGAGIRGCIGWRFAVMELQSVVTELLSNFEFSIPRGAPDIQHCPVGFATIPIALGKAKEGPQVPLLVTALTK